MKRSPRLIVAAIAALVLTQPLAGCIPIGIKGQSLPWAAASPAPIASLDQSSPTPAAVSAPGVAAIVSARASM
jgi:hypothetical protein